MASKTPAEKKTPRIDTVLIDLPAAAMIADAAPAFEPTQTAEQPRPATAVPFAAPPARKKAAPNAARKTTSEITPKPTAATSTPIVDETTAAPTEEKTKMDTTNTAPFNADTAQFADKAKTMIADATAKGTAAFADVNEFGKGNIEAIVESGKIAVRGIEAMGQDAADYGRRQFEGVTAVLKNLSGVKSPTDFFKLQGDYMRTSFDSMVAQASKNTETMLKLAGEIAQPIQNRVAVAVEKVKLAA